VAGSPGGVSVVAIGGSGAGAVLVAGTAHDRFGTHPTDTL